MTTDPELVNALQGELNRIYAVTRDEDVLLLGQQARLNDDWDAVTDYLVLDHFGDAIRFAEMSIEDGVPVRKALEWLVLTLSKTYAAHDYYRDKQENDDE